MLDTFLRWVGYALLALATSVTMWAALKLLVEIIECLGDDDEGAGPLDY